MTMRATAFRSRAGDFDPIIGKHARRPAIAVPARMARGPTCIRCPRWLPPKHRAALAGGSASPRLCCLQAQCAGAAHWLAGKRLHRQTQSPGPKLVSRHCCSVSRYVLWSMLGPLLRVTMEARSGHPFCHRWALRAFSSRQPQSFELKTDGTHNAAC